MQRADPNECRNVLIFCVDEMRADHMACAGNTVVKTPNLDHLASRGTVFQRSYCNNPICMPARATMFTGLLPRDHGLRVNGQAMRTDLPTLASVLADAGYRTHSAGKLHLTPWVPLVDPPEPEKYPECLQYWNDGLITEFPVPYYGFQSVDLVGGHTSFTFGEYVNWLKDQGEDPRKLTPAAALQQPCGAPLCYHMGLPAELHYNRYIADSTIRVIREHENAERPFFAWCSFPDPHMPIAPPAPYCNMYDPAEIPAPVQRDGEIDQLPACLRRIADGNLKYEGQSCLEPVTGKQWREMIALTYGMISHVDNEIGRVLNALEQCGATDNTLIIFLSDHGDMMGDHGFIWKGPYTYQACARIPTIVSAPGMPGGMLHHGLISQIDLFPSVLDYCGLPLPGSDWKETARFDWGQVEELNLYPGQSWTPMLSDPDAMVHDSVVIENDNPATGYHIRCLVTDRYRLTVYPGNEDGELFDLQTDPDELFNLWYKPESEGLKNQLIQKLLHDYCRQSPFYPVPPWNS